MPHDGPPLLIHLGLTMLWVSFSLKITWVILGIESFQSSEVNVYNKWGQQVHLNSPYNNEAGWDGTQNGSDLPSGTYFYVITVFNNCQEESLAGVVNIIR